MIKQENNVFALIRYTATIDDESYLVDDQERFEKHLLENLKRKAYNEARKENRRAKLDDITVLLPAITYTENSLTTEQQARLDYMNTFTGLTLDEVMNYVMNEVEPTSLEYVTRKLETENTTLSERLESLNEENQSLMAQNLEIMSVLADLYENMNTGDE